MHESWKKSRRTKDAKFTWAKVGERLKNKERRRKMRRARTNLRLSKFGAIVRKKETVERKLTEKFIFSGKWKGEGKRIEVFRVGGIWIFMLRGGRKESSTDTERDPVQISEHWIHFFSHFICDFCSGFASKETRGHITRSFLCLRLSIRSSKGWSLLQNMLNRWN